MASTEGGGGKKMVSVEYIDPWEDDQNGIQPKQNNLQLYQSISQDLNHISVRH